MKGTEVSFLVMYTYYFCKVCLLYPKNLTK